MRRSVLALVVLAAAFAAHVPRALACSCMATTPAESLAASAAVFEGVVTAIEPVEGEGFRARLRVTQTWKGADSEMVDVVTPSDSAGCGYAFQQGESYLVYAHVALDESARPVEPFVLRVSLCSRTRLASEADEDRAFLGVGATPVDVEAGIPPAEQAVPPSRGGCASCAVGIPADAPLALGAVLAAVAAALARPRKRRR